MRGGSRMKLYNIELILRSVIATTNFHIHVVE